jgi:hypothetical protein
MAIRTESTAMANCRPEHVWRVFQDTAAWPQWNRVMGRAEWTAGQPWQMGSKLKISIVNPITFTLEPSVVRCEPPSWVHLSGGGMGTNGELAFSFEPQADGMTLLRARSEVTGPATLFVTEKIKADIQRVFNTWLESLKAESERVARAEAARPSDLVQPPDVVQPSEAVEPGHAVGAAEAGRAVDVTRIAGAIPLPESSQAAGPETTDAELGPATLGTE